MVAQSVLYTILMFTQHFYVMLTTIFLFGALNRHRGRQAIVIRVTASQYCLAAREILLSISLVATEILLVTLVNL